MNWLLLITAGLFEVVSGTTLRHSESFSFTSFLLTVFAMGVGFYLIGIALRSLPLGAACAVWVGTAVTGTILFDETIIPAILIVVILVTTGIIKFRLCLR